jgi:hypothetical protein
MKIWKNLVNARPSLTHEGGTAATNRAVVALCIVAFCHNDAQRNNYLTGQSAKIILEKAVANSGKTGQLVLALPWSDNCRHPCSIIRLNAICNTGLTIELHNYHDQFQSSQQDD